MERINNETNEVVAIKVLNLDTEEDDVADIRKELNYLSQLKHSESQNITRYYASFLHGTKLWIVMEYAAGGSIRELMRAGRIEEKYISVITKEVLQALSYLHKCKIIHRDIKAANILLTAEGKVQLCDFGVAGQLTATSSKRTSFVGTPYWMAPEVITEGATYDTKADIWSLGITVYEIATGNPPFADQSAHKAIQLIPRSPPAQLEGPFQVPIKEFVSKCLNESPEERPTADDLIKQKFIKNASKLPNGLLRDLKVRYDNWKQATGYRHSFSDPFSTPSSESDGFDLEDDRQPDDDYDWEFDTVRSSVSSFTTHRKSQSTGSLTSNPDSTFASSPLVTAGTGGATGSLLSPVLESSDEQHNASNDSQQQSYFTDSETQNEKDHTMLARSRNLSLEFPPHRLLQLFEPDTSTNSDSQSFNDKNNNVNNGNYNYNYGYGSNYPDSNNNTEPSPTFLSTPTISIPSVSAMNSMISPAAQIAEDLASRTITKFSSSSSNNNDQDPPPSSTSNKSFGATSSLVRSNSLSSGVRSNNDKINNKDFRHDFHIKDLPKPEIKFPPPQSADNNNGNNSNNGMGTPISQNYPYLNNGLLSPTMDMGNQKVDQQQPQPSPTLLSPTFSSPPISPSTQQRSSPMNVRRPTITGASEMSSFNFPSISSSSTIVGSDSGSGSGYQYSSSSPTRSVLASSSPSTSFTRPLPTRHMSFDTPNDSSAITRTPSSGELIPIRLKHQQQQNDSNNSNANNGGIVIGGSNNSSNLLVHGTRQRSVSVNSSNIQARFHTKFPILTEAEKSTHLLSPSPTANTSTATTHFPYQQPVSLSPTRNIFATETTILNAGPEIRPLKMDNYRATKEVCEDLSVATDDLIRWLGLLDAGFGELLKRF
ncbi:11406_t:CDS:10 [Ambispora gerdemannii]|uniref:non-specific serine/threonine protein kinase n=1 Tax=Ambispora gerdemannii TaxID=144530 RepID=A0A9N8V8V1_9GLOM|nr:11406_t:CDS:10 [Ambispora gerdemannii]